MKLKYTLGILVALVLAACTNANESSSATSAPVQQASPLPQASATSDSTIAVAHGSAVKVPESALTPTAGTAPQGGAQSAGGLSWVAPKRWTIGPERAMRAATYRVPAASGDTEDGECAVFFFGPGQGGGVEANI